METKYLSSSSIDDSNLWISHARDSEINYQQIISIIKNKKLNEEKHSPKLGVETISNVESDMQLFV